MNDSTANASPSVAHRGPKTRPVEQRFWPKVQKTDGCWLWTGCTNSDGYGQLWAYETRSLAHRVSWQLVNGSIPYGIQVLHKCDNPLCVNPEHLWLGTHQDNMRDMAIKGRANSGAPPGEQHGRAKLSKKDVIEIRRRYAAGGVTQQKLCEKYGVGNQHISQIVNFKKWKHLAGDF